MIRVDRFHYIADALTDVAVIVSISNRSVKFLDPLCAIGIALYIVYGSYMFFKQAFVNLVDEEFPASERQKILEIIAKNPLIKGLHELKTRYAANKPFIQCHIEMDGNISLYEAHIISDKICADLLASFPGGEIIIHQDPAGVETEVDYRENIKF
jgi:cation diffusion facilitator family transporter